VALSRPPTRRPRAVVEDNRRIEALLSVICLASSISCLVEREVRRLIAPELEMTGFSGRPTARPTGRLSSSAHSPRSTSSPPPPSTADDPEPTGVQARIVNLLDVDPPHLPLTGQEPTDMTT